MKILLNKILNLFKTYKSEMKYIKLFTFIIFYRSRCITPNILKMLIITFIIIFTNISVLYFSQVAFKFNLLKQKNIELSLEMEAISDNMVKNKIDILNKVTEDILFFKWITLEIIEFKELMKKECHENKFK